MAVSLSDSGLARVFLGAWRGIRFRENPAKYGCFQRLSDLCGTRKTLAYKHFELLLSRKTLFAEQKINAPKTAL
jgi:hypothetical protein